MIELETPGNPRLKFQNFDRSFNDGRWYELSLLIVSNKLLLKVNEEQAVTNRLITFVSGPTVHLGGSYLFLSLKLKFILQNLSIKRRKQL